MTNHRWRIGAAERQLSLDGPQTPCPSCDGSGRGHGCDSAWMGWRLRSAMAEVAARMDVVVADDPAPNRTSR
jgi:hypothetical protein